MSTRCPTSTVVPKQDPCALPTSRVAPARHGARAGPKQPDTRAERGQVYRTRPVQYRLWVGVKLGDDIHVALADVASVSLHQYQLNTCGLHAANRLA